ncbi:MAG: hypothetical protein OES47_14085, partial [Acidobacteriota bacterium]|nr:hypothetical protein [Acidobacteriota bacterium]
EHVYDEAILDAVSRYEAQVQRKLRYEEWIPAPRPSREYRREASSVAEKRVVEAGYRLAAVIEHLEL